MKEIYLNLLGINEKWSQKVIIKPRLIISFDNLSADGLILLKNMLSTIDLTIDNEEVQIKEILPANLLQNNFESQTVFLISDLLKVTSTRKIFFCPHPNTIIQDSSLKSEVWRTIIELQKALSNVD